MFFQARLEELQAQKQEVVVQKEAADDENRKLVGEKCSIHIPISASSISLLVPSVSTYRILGLQGWLQAILLKIFIHSTYVKQALRNEQQTLDISKF